MIKLKKSEKIINIYDLPEKYVCPTCGKRTTIRVEVVKFESELWNFITITRGKRYICNKCESKIRNPN